MNGGDEVVGVQPTCYMCILFNPEKKGVEPFWRLKIIRFCTVFKVGFIFETPLKSGV